MTPFRSVTAIAAPLDIANVDTDQLIPARFMRKSRGHGYQDFLLHDLRFDGEGGARPEFVLNRPGFEGAGILVADRNFGGGSSREGAVYALVDYGIRVVAAPSFGDIFAANAAKNGLVAAIVAEAECAELRAMLSAAPGARLTVDLEAQEIRTPDGRLIRFIIDAFHRHLLLNGLDDITLTLEHASAIEAFEAAYVEHCPWAADAKLSRSSEELGNR